MEHVEALIKALGHVEACREIEHCDDIQEAVHRLHCVLKRVQHQAVADVAKDALKSL